MVTLSKFHNFQSLIQYLFLTVLLAKAVPVKSFVKASKLIDWDAIGMQYLDLYSFLLSGHMHVPESFASYWANSLELSEYHYSKYDHRETPAATFLKSFCKH